jgi:2-desacetyl-2-hydroxyethyl bacteriochlorophyllide A dehydrogenase
MKTKAVIFPEANKYELIDLPVREPGPRDMVVRTLVTAISPGTERWVLRGKHIGTKFPCVPGYHRIGIVESCGKDVSNYGVGDVVYGGGYEGGYLNVISMWGAHVGMSVNDWSTYQLISPVMPGKMELEALAFTVVASVANRGIRFLDVKAGQRLAIIGAGFIGICAAQLASKRGAVTLLVEKDPERVSFARGLGHNAICIDDADIDAKLKANAPDGFDLLYDSAGHANTTDRMVQHMKQQGTMLMQAQYFDKAMCAVDLDQIKIRELTIRTTCGIGPQDWLDTANLIRARYLQIAPMITHRFRSADALRGYELLDTGKQHNLGIVFYWD